jgi:hypothetical protein
MHRRTAGKMEISHIKWLTLALLRRPSRRRIQVYFGLDCSGDTEVGT